MAKRNKSHRKPTHQASKQSQMTREKISEARTWLERIRLNATRAVKLSQRMSPVDVDESNDQFWALAKYAENVQESIVQLDKINKNIYPALIELDKDLWQNLKGMRSRLVHAFWKINPTTLWSTVTSDFPILLELLSTMVVIDDPTGDSGPFTFAIETEHLSRLPDSTPDSEEVGSRIVVVCFGHSGKVRVFRIGHDSGDTLFVSANPSFVDGRISIYGRKREAKASPEVG